MATRTVTHKTDDLDGSDADLTLSYTFDGQAYEIDLNEKNAEEFREAMAPYIAASRKAGQPKGGSGRRSPGGSSKPAQGDGQLDTQAVRVWAQQNGLEVSSRGRISAKVLEQYRAAH